MYVKKLYPNDPKPHYETFSVTELKIADYFVSLGMDLVNKTLSNLAEETDFSESTIFKFVKRIGFKGFQDFKISVASNYRMSEERTHQLAVFTDITASDTPSDISKKVIQSSQIMLQSLMSKLSGKLCNKLLILSSIRKRFIFLVLVPPQSLRSTPITSS